MWSYFTWRCFSLSTRVLRVCAIIIIVSDVLFPYTLSLSISLSLKITTRIRVLLMCCYSVHRSPILSGYIVVVFDYRRTVNFRQDHTRTYTYHCVNHIISAATDHARGYLRSLKSVNITDVIVAQAENTEITSRMIFERCYGFG